MSKQAIQTARLAGMLMLVCVVTAGCRGSSSGKPWWDFWSKETKAAPGPEQNLEPLPPPPMTGGPEVTPEGLQMPEVPGEGNMNLANARPTGGATEAVSALQTVYFAYDRADIDSREQAKLESSAAWLQENPTTQVLLEGHCDERGTREYNFALGERRAIAVREFLAAKGVRPENLKVISYGKDRPIDPGHNEAAWAKNRRVQFLVYK
ncbi:MAG: peptidoglycan-associated lipoprotein Pal [Candidatus Sumerlaeota bacterium]|nr:peptidoglycan-associated lipoprotein Pal [Candidatus Sumerlaeota bacterium]